MLLFGYLMLGGCSANGVHLLSAQHWGEAAIGAAKHPLTWGPLSGAVVFSATNLDEALSDWAADEKPIFGNAEIAADVSDGLRSGLLAGMVASSVLAPLPSDRGQGVLGRRLAASLLAYGSSRGSTDGLKAAVGRERPDEENDKSFPSGHASTAFVSAASIEQHVIGDLSPGLQIAVQTGLFGLAGTTAWARLEARKHFPSDVLVGAALGNFFAKFFYGALVGASKAPPLTVETSVDRIAFRLNYAL